jgi:hypothetical protein
MHLTKVLVTGNAPASGNPSTGVVPSEFPPRCRLINTDLPKRALDLSEMMDDR